MRKFLLLFVLMSTAAFVPGAATAASAVDDAIAEVRTRLLEARPSMPILDIKQSILGGFYEVTLLGGQRLHISHDGQFLFTSDLYQVSSGGFDNLTEAGRNSDRKQLLDELDENEQEELAELL